MENENDKRLESIYSKRLRAGKRRTYFFDVRSTKGNDYYLTITESRKRFDDNGYDRHKVFLYKEDFNKFIKALNEAVDFVKTDLMPDFDFDVFNHDDYQDVEDAPYKREVAVAATAAVAAAPEPEPEITEVPATVATTEEVVVPEAPSTINPTQHEDVDKW